MGRTYRSSKKIQLAEDRGVSKLGLAECRDMDLQLRQSGFSRASTKFCDVHSGLLDEIFENKYFSTLLGIRRVCKDWYWAISRKSAPFLRNVVLSTDFFIRLTNFWKMEGNTEQFWAFSEDATALVVCGKKEQDIRRGYAHWKYDPTCHLWDSCTMGNHSPINKVIYANMLVDSDCFQFPAFRKVGFQTVLYRSTLKLVIGEIFPYKKNPHSHSPSFSDRLNVLLKVTKFASYTLKEADLEQMKDTWAYWSKESGAPVFNPVAEQLARKHCTRLLDSVLVVLADGTVFEHTRSVAVQDLVKQLITSKTGDNYRWAFSFCCFDPRNVKALDLYDKGDVIGFAKAARPLVSVLLHRFLQYDMKTIR